MIEQIMFFALGALMAALAGLAMLPVLWRRAARLTRERLEATLPLTPDAITAERDQIRARFAVELRRSETEVEAAGAALHRAKVEIGEKLAAISSRDISLLDRAARIGSLESALNDARDAITSLQEREERLTRERDNLLTNLEAARQSAQAQDEAIAALRQTSDQSQARVGSLEVQVESLGARLADSVGVANGLRDDIQRRTDELRSAAQTLREQTSALQSLERRLAASETTAQDRAVALDAVQAERLRLIDDLGHVTRARDHEHVERTALASSAASLQRRVADLEEALAHARKQAQDTIADLTRAADHLREERRATDSEMSTLRFTKARLETDLQRLRRKVAEGDMPVNEPPAHDPPANEPAAIEPPADPQPVPQPRPT